LSLLTLVHLTTSDCHAAAMSPITSTTAPSAFPEAYLTTDEVLALLRISRATLHRWMDNDGFPVHGRGTRRHLRFVWSEVQTWMADQSKSDSSSSTTISEITG
jgi:excisionase family DNA binding protein